MQLTKLSAISPIDGRYRSKCESIAAYFSEFGLIRYRVKIEVEYFIALCNLNLPQLPQLDNALLIKLRDIYKDFNEKDAQQIKDTEKVTNHDVKAVEYFVKARLEAANLGQYKEFVHFGLTSQDINNTATPLLLKDAFDFEMLPELQGVIEHLEDLVEQWAEVPLLARTHGQPASPTTLGKEIDVFATRLNNQLCDLLEVPYSAKFGGATGNMNAHYVAYPKTDWHAFANEFVEEVLTLNRSNPTTQIEHYDDMAAFCQAFSRFNTILIDLCRDVWTYISMDYFKQKIAENEVGSSAMPHKVNPIDFENAEGNLGMANAIFGHLAAKLPISRLQRDLTDSTVLRNIGMPIAHSLIALKSIKKGLGKLLLNQQAIERDLENNWAVVAEAIQTILRRENYPKPYEALKELTRTNQTINQQSMHAFIDDLKITDTVKAELKAITPFNYIGK